MKKILFDLDGTLTDPKVGITTCIRYALDRLAIPAPEALDWCIGPPLHESFRILLSGGNTEEVANAVAIYRERFGTKGLYENEIYAGVPEMLERLSSAGLELYVATSKAEVYAEQIVDHFGFRKYFVRVFGAELDGTRSEKGALISHILSELGGAPQDFLMIGDRKFDLIGARKNSVPAVGILWGYGSEEELEAESPISLKRTPTELADFVMELAT